MIRKVNFPFCGAYGSNIEKLALIGFLCTLKLKILLKPRGS